MNRISLMLGGVLAAAPLLAYPNPSQGAAVRLSRPVSGALLDLTGRAVRQLAATDQLETSGLAAGVFGLPALGGLGGVSFLSQLVGTLGGIAIATAGGTLVYGALKATVGLRLDREAEFDGADLSIHRISATPERD